MPSSIVPRLGMLALLAGGIAAGGWWFLSHSSVSQSPSHGVSHSTSPSPETEVASGGQSTAANPDQAVTQKSDFSEPIDFPQDMWKAAGLRIAAIELAPMNEAIELTGKIALNEDKLAHIFPLVEGRVNEVKIRFGQQVKKGDLLLVVQSKEVGQGMLQLYQDRQRLDFAKARNQWTQEVSKNTLSLIEMMSSGSTTDEMEQALKDRTMGDYREKLMTAYLTRLKAQAHLERLSPLSNSGAVPARQILEAETDLNAASASLQSLLEQISQDAIQASRLAEQTIKELQTSIAVTETNLKILGFKSEQLQNIDPAEQGEAVAYYPVVAPFDGTVISKDVVLLERVGPDRQILTIADLSTVWVTADIYESHLPILTKLTNQALRLRSEAWPEKTFEARIFYTGDVVQETTRTIALRAVADNPEGLLKPGMFVTVELPNLNTTEVLQLPISAIQDHEGESFVFVQSGDAVFERRNVKLGRRNHQRMEILSGLTAKDQVVVEGGFALKSKMLADLLAE